MNFIKPEDCLKYDVCKYANDPACLEGCDYRIDKEFFNQERQAKEELLKALNKLEIDNHYWSTRPCSTCQGITDLIGKPFGCVKLRKAKHTEKDKEIKGCLS